MNQGHEHMWQMLVMMEKGEPQTYGAVPGVRNVISMGDGVYDWVY